MQALWSVTAGLLPPTGSLDVLTGEVQTMGLPLVEGAKAFWYVARRWDSGLPAAVAGDTVGRLHQQQDGQGLDRRHRALQHARVSALSPIHLSEPTRP